MLLSSTLSLQKYLLNMDTRLYHTALAIKFGVTGIPDVHVSLDGDEIHNGTINKSMIVCIDCDLELGKHVLVIEHRNKQPSDPSTELIIESISLNGIDSPKFAWQGIYSPNYPEPWATEQLNAGRKLEQELASTTHLGWNGKWTLTFTAPVFTWIHQVEDLGWIHQ
jgi:hypothetical protein